MAPIHAARWQRTLKHLGSLSSILGRPVNVLQIGANDGKQSDPVHRFITDFGWRGVLVEPVSRNFKALAATYATQVSAETVSLVRAAITQEIGQATMYVPKLGDDALKGKESLHPRVIQKHDWMVRGGWRDHMAEESVPTLTLSALLRAFPGFKPDVVVTDTEGHDAVIIDQFDLLSPTRPLVVMHEHAHLNPSDRSRIREKLIGAGYSLTALRRDTVALLNL